jgi:hypothetical protein
MNPSYLDSLKRHGLAVPAVDDTTPSITIADSVLAAGRPLFVDGLQIHILKTFPSYPYGTTFRVLPRGSTLPAIHEVFATNKALYAAFQFESAAPARDDDWAAHAHERYAKMWAIIGRALEAENQRDDAAFAFEAARTLGPVR